MAEGTQKEKDEDVILGQLTRLVYIAFYSLIPLALAFLVVGVLANSLTVLSIAMDYGLSFIVQLFAYQSIRAIQSANVIKFPYGTGKLENFSAFLYGALAIPTGLYILCFSVSRILSPPESISFTIAQIPLLPSLARSLYLFVRSRRLKRQADSPLVDSYYVGFKVATFFDVGVVLALGTAWVLTYQGHGAAAYYVDPAVSLILALYMLYTGVKLTEGNFKILMDLPLPEEEQLKIVGVLAREFESYENVGNIYTRRSGRQRFISIELYLKENTTIKDLTLLQGRMQKHLEEHFEDVRFSLIPLPSPGTGEGD